MPSLGLRHLEEKLMPQLVLRRSRESIIAGLHLYDELACLTGVGQIRDGVKAPTPFSFTAMFDSRCPRPERSLKTNEAELKRAIIARMLACLTSDVGQ